MLNKMAETPAMRPKVAAAAAAALRGCPAGSAPSLLSAFVAEAAAAAAAAASALLAEEEADAAKTAASKHKSERKKAAKQRRKADAASDPQAAASCAGGSEQPLPACQPALAPTPAFTLPSPQPQPLPAPPPPQTQTQPLAVTHPTADFGGLRLTAAPPATVSPPTPPWLHSSDLQTLQMEEDASQRLPPLLPPQPLADAASWSVASSSRRHARKSGPVIPTFMLPQGTASATATVSASGSASASTLLPRLSLQHFSRLRFRSAFQPICYPEDLHPRLQPHLASQCLTSADRLYE